MVNWSYLHGLSSKHTKFFEVIGKVSLDFSKVNFSSIMLRQTQDVIAAAVHPDVSESRRMLREHNQPTLSLLLLEACS